MADILFTVGVFPSSIFLIIVVVAAPAAAAAAAAKASLRLRSRPHAAAAISSLEGMPNFVVKIAAAAAAAAVVQWFRPRSGAGAPQSRARRPAPV